MASVKLLSEKKRDIQMALKKTGIPKKLWCKDEAYVSNSTLKRFLNGTPISIENFQSIFKALGIEEWQAYADWGEETQDSTRVIDFAQCDTIDNPPTESEGSNSSGGFLAIGGISPSSLKAIKMVLDTLKETLLKCNVTVSPDEESVLPAEETDVPRQLVVTGSFKELDRLRAIALLEHLTQLLLECELKVW